MASPLESAILNLLQCSTNEGQIQGYNEIKGLFKDPAVNVSLCNCVTQAQEPEVRRYAAFLLRRRLLRAKHWRKVPPDVKVGLKQSLLEAYLKDTEKKVRNAIAELIAAIAKHELADGKWPELMELLNQSVRSNNVTDREVGLYTLSVITDALRQKLKPHFKSLLSLFQKTLVDQSSIEIPFYTLRALTHMIFSIGTEELNLLQSMVPNVINMIRLIASDDQEKACQCLEIFDELIESEVAVIAPFVKSVIEFCLEIVSCDKFYDGLRIKAMNIIGYLIRLKKKAIIKQKLAQPILDILFPLMCNPCPGDVDPDDEDDDDELETSLPSAAGQTIDVMALHLPPAKFLPILMHHLEPAFESQIPHQRKAAYLALSVIAEGCSEFIRYKYLQSFIQVISKGIKDENVIVRNAAMYAVGQYAEYLQPDISKYASDLLPILFEHLERTCLFLQQGNKDPPNIKRTFYAVERFCENLEDIKPYLPILMTCLTTFLTINTVQSLTVKELTVEAIGSVAAAAKEAFVPYFPSVVEELKRFISEKQTDQTRPLQMQSIDTLATIARSVGPATFMPIAHDCIKCGLHLMDENDDPDIRRSCYGLFSSVSVVLKSEMTPYLSSLVECMLLTLRSTEGIGTISTLMAESHPGLTLFEDLDDEENGDMGNESLGNVEEDDDDDDDDDIAGLSIENSYVNEKEAACLALKEMCEEIEAQFIPYIEPCFNEIKKLVECPSDDVRRAAVSALGQFCITLNKVYSDTGSLECRVALEQNLGILLPKLFSLAREDTEHVVVIACLETVQNIIDNIKQNALYAGSLDSISSLIKDVFNQKLACQDEDDDADDQEGEYDCMVMEYAGEIIASLGKVVPWQQFGPYLAGLMPLLLARTRKACTISEKSFAVGTLAEIVSSMEPGVSWPFLNHLQPVFLAAMRDENEEVRSNAVYGLGVLVQNAGTMVFDQYPTYLQALSNMVASEEDLRARDNICATVARLIKTNIGGVPLNGVFPIFLQYLPLKVDFEENITVYDCLSYLHSIRFEEFFQSLPQMLKILSEALVSQKLDDSTLSVVSTLIKNICTEFPNDFEAVVKSLPQINAELLIKARTV